MFFSGSHAALPIIRTTVPDSNNSGEELDVVLWLLSHTLKTNGSHKHPPRNGFDSSRSLTDLHNNDVVMTCCSRNLQPFVSSCESATHGKGCLCLSKSTYLHRKKECSLTVLVSADNSSSVAQKHMGKATPAHNPAL